MTQQSIVTSLRDNYMPYTAHVIMSRALPEIDGLKPSQRRILYTMFKMGLLKGNRKKSQGVVGQTMFLHPHGDMPIYETLVRMAKDNESLLHPYIDSKGNFGKQYSRDMKYASARYTEVKLADIANELFHDIDQDTVDMIDNYDGTLKEPRLFPVNYPSVLINTSSGTAVGMASSMAPFNLNEVIDFTIAYIQSKEVVVGDYILAPDFSTGGQIIYNAKDFKQIYETGKGSFKIRATYKIQGNSIIFEQIPYTTTFEAVIDKITDLVKEGKIKDIVDIDDIYGIDSKGIEIQVKSSTDKERLIARLYKLTPLEDSFTCNFNLIVNGRPQTLGVKQIVHEWLVFRSNCIQRGALYELDKKKKKKHLLKAFREVLLDIDRAIVIVRGTKLNKQVVSNLMEAFQIDEAQAEYVAEIKLRFLNEEYLLSRIAEIEKLEKEIQELNELSSDASKRSLVIVEQLNRVKKQYGKERCSLIVQANDLPMIKEEQISIDNYNVRVFVTKEGYLKKIPLVSLRSSNQLKVKDGDYVVREIDSTNHSDILIFTNKQNCYKYKTYELDDHKPSALGEFLPTLLGLQDEEILYVTVTNDYKGHLIIGFDDGKVAKIDLSAYSTKNNRTMLKNAYADKHSIYWDTTQEDYDLMALSTIDKIIVVNTSIVNPKTSKTTIGVQLMKSKKESLVSDYHKLSSEGYEEREYYRTLSAGVGKYYREGDFTDLVDLKMKRLGQGVLM
ncbi:DNA gyrase/topoisomerase IV subunit A [Croceifilum oryzae]|uniref:DNA gyrase/topoisomerase IV subunit A n=1 Tax=Croceifilum oryzae TaxID=1553429 RepID=A0AAJ1WRH0_9BACL|nr:DNA topoisomerase (ATP-hydrolyzing) subunit A [Croceifilum oryzae]MDQ0416318.1 DNA gyrase/topoisomerase IV subunit A [Croceifilum oryzae]